MVSQNEIHAQQGRQTPGEDDSVTQPNPEQRSHMTRQKAGQRGGQATAKRHGREFYERIGRKGGQSRKKRNRSKTLA